MSDKEPPVLIGLHHRTGCACSACSQARPQRQPSYAGMRFSIDPRLGRNEIAVDQGGRRTVFTLDPENETANIVRYEKPRSRHP